MKNLRKTTLITALALCAMPTLLLAGEAAPAGAPVQQDTEQRLADAQRRLEAAAREVGELSGQLGQRRNLQFSFGPGEGPPPRAMLGVSIGNGNEKDGAHVLEVSPGGPAAEAGIKSGDIIIAIAGTDLTKDSNPGRALVETMRQMDPDLKVQVGVLRDGKKLSFDVTPRAAPAAMARRGGPGGPMGPGMRQFDLPALPLGGPGMGPLERRIEIIRGGDPGARFGGAEFATLSERLGSYFGVKAGVLVVRAGVNSPFKLQDGDVILAIDGREAATAQHAGRILRSYQAGEKLTLRLQRDRKAQNIEVTAPTGRDND
jgi:S1-C subfamily serine protease